MRSSKKLCMVLIVVFIFFLIYIGNDLYTPRQVKLTAATRYHDSSHDKPHNNVNFDPNSNKKHRKYRNMQFDPDQQMTRDKEAKLSKRMGVYSEDRKPHVKKPPDQQQADVSRREADITKKSTWKAYHRKQCHNLHLTESVPSGDFNTLMFKQYLVDDKRKLVFCQIPKVATTTWRRIFMVLTGKVNTTDPSSLMPADVHGQLDNVLTRLSELTPDEIRYRLRHYFKFLFVRDPLERLLSAYRNKIGSKKKWSEYYSKVFSYEIAKKYRHSPISDIDPQNPNVSFVEFVKYLSDPEPTMKSDDHWRQYHKLCNPCLVDFDFVGKLENVQIDSDYVFKKAGIDDILKFPTREESRYIQPETKNFLQKEYSKLSSEEFKDLIAQYKVDFILFNYTLPEHLNSL